MIDQGVDVWHCAPTGAFVEEETIRWLCDLVGYGAGSFGVLTSGGVMANIMAMAVARDVHLARLVAGRPGHDDASRRRGDPLPDPPRAAALAGARVYASDQAHFSIGRALDLLGFEPDALRIVPSDDRFRLQAGPVADAIAADRAAGLRPFAIAAVAGSTNTGSVDDIAGLADLAAAEDLWLHADAAYGAGALLSERDAGRMGPLHRADSVTVDPHKWFFQPYDVGSLLVRRIDDLRDTFHREPEYYRTPGHEEEPLSFYQYSMEGTRRFRALKLWMSWKHLGTRGLGRLVERTDDIAARLAALIAASDDFEALPPEPELSVVCFRWLPGGRERGGATRRCDARRGPGRPPARARGLGRGLGLHHAPPGRDVAAGRDRELPLHRGRRGRPARRPPAPRRRRRRGDGPVSQRTTDLYKILQVDPEADVEIIGAAYRKLAQRYHPDVADDPDAASKMAAINAAWEVLRDPEKRAAYDRERRFGPTGASPGRVRRGRPGRRPRGRQAPRVAVRRAAGDLDREPVRLVRVRRRAAGGRPHGGGRLDARRPRHVHGRRREHGERREVPGRRCGRHGRDAGRLGGAAAGPRERQCHHVRAVPGLVARRDRPLRPRVHRVARARARRPPVPAGDRCDPQAVRAPVEERPWPRGGWATGPGGARPREVPATPATPARPPDARRASAWRPGAGRTVA